jgi:hypothetical protein
MSLSRQDLTRWIEIIARFGEPGTYVLRSDPALKMDATPELDVAHFAPGGGVDIIARLIGQLLTERLGQPFVIRDYAEYATEKNQQDDDRRPAPVQPYNGGGGGAERRRGDGQK